jgi:hypothetical protein
MYNFTQQQKDFLIEYGYLILDTYDYTHDAINEASDELKKVVDNNLFTKLTLTRNTLTSEQLDFITNNFPNVKFTNDKIDEWIGTQSDLESIQTYIFKNSRMYYSFFRFIYI